MNNEYDGPSLVHYVNIWVYDNKRNLIKRLSWKGLVFELRIKYDWYFKYRAALLQVKYPKFTVEYRWGSEVPTGRTAEYILNKKIQGKKAVITKYKNLIKQAEKDWDYLFPINDDLLYKKAVAKVKRLEFELEEFLNGKKI